MACRRGGRQFAPHGHDFPGAARRARDVSAPATILTTPRLVLREISPDDDAPFILALLNEPSFLEFIGDRGVRTLDDARRYITEGPVASYARHGFGLWLVSLQEGGEKIGMCGLLKRDALEDVDIGFAYLPAYWSRGYGIEAARAVLAHGRQVLGIPRIVAITAPHNEASGRLLERLGLRCERIVHLPGHAQESRLFVPADATEG